MLPIWLPTALFACALAPLSETPAFTGPSKPSDSTRTLVPASTSASIARPELLVGEWSPSEGLAKVSLISLKKRERTSTAQFPFRSGESGFQLSALESNDERTPWVATFGFAMFAVTGRVAVCSGADPSPCALPDSTLGDSIVLGPCGSAGDVNGDGKGDFWLSTRNKTTGKYAVEVRSVTDGKRIASIPYENGIDENTPKYIGHGGCVVTENWEIKGGFVRDAEFGDFNSDGKKDCLLVRWPSASDAWHLQMFTIGETKPQVARSWRGTEWTTMAATPLVGAFMDCDACLLFVHDRTIEWLRRADLSTVGSGTVDPWSAAERTVLVRNRGAAHRLAVPRPKAANDCGEVAMYGCDGKFEVRERIRGTSPDRAIGSTTINIGDITDDGIDDLALSESDPKLVEPSVERILLYSSASGNCIGRIEFHVGEIVFR